MSAALPQREAGKPRVVFFLPGLAVGGAERHTLDLRRRLEELGYPTGLIVYGRDLAPSMLAMPGAHDAVLLKGGGAFDLKTWRRARDALRAQRPAILFTVDLTPAIVTGVLRLGLRAKVISIFHATLPRPGQGKRLVLFRMAVRFFDALVYVSENQRRYWHGRGLRARRDQAIVNGIDLPAFAARDGREARRALGLPAGDFVMGLVATFRREKNHGQLVDALAALRQRGVPARIVFVGDGPCRADVAAQVEALGLAPYVLFAGEQADVRPFLPAFDVGVLCSTSIETLSLAALEMLASGVPLVLSDIGGASEIVTEGVNGFLFEAGRTDQLVDRLLRLSDPGTLAACKAQARPSAARFDVEAMVAAYVRLIGEFA